jgi:hypothetical protein
VYALMVKNFLLLFCCSKSQSQSFSWPVETILKILSNPLPKLLSGNSDPENTYWRSPVILQNNRVPYQKPPKT